MTIIGKVLVILGAVFVLAIVILAIYLKIAENIRVEKEIEEHKKSLFRYLQDIEHKILSFHNYDRKKLDGVHKDFCEINWKILELYNKNSGIKTMRFMDSLAYHEKNALIKVVDALNVGVLLTDAKIQGALIEITEGLNKHYAEFCNIQTSDVEEETYILKVLQQKESERLELQDLGNLEEQSKDRKSTITQ